MKGKLHPRNDATLNPSGNESIRELIERVDQGRRRFVQGSASATLLASAGGLTLSGVVTSVEATSLARADRGRGVGIGELADAPALDTLPELVEQGCQIRSPCLLVGGEEGGDLIGAEAGVGSEERGEAGKAEGESALLGAELLDHRDQLATERFHIFR